MLSKQEQQEERRGTFAPDQSIPPQATTFYQRAQADVAMMPRDRYSLAQVTTAYVVGSKSDVASAYPAAAAHQRDPVPDEPSLGYAINEVEPPLASSSCAQGQLGEPPSPLRGSPQPNPAPADATSSSDDCDVERRGAGLGLFRRRI
jgi:hypothetical protein